MTTVAVLGANGMLGHDLVAELARSNLRVQPFSYPPWDITRPDHLPAAVAEADAIINCAAYTNVDGAEREAALAHAINAEAVGRLGALAAAAGRYLLHVSTDFVFDGEKPAPYTEADEPRPLGVYGASKWAGEQALAASGCRHAIVRIEWTYGRHGTHFVAKLAARARQQRELAVVADQVGAPTATTAVATVLRQVLERRLTGTYLYAAAGYASRYEVANLIVARLGLPVTVRPCATADFPAPARRPLNSRFCCDRLEQALGLVRPPWQDDLTAFLEHGFEH